MKTAFPLLSTLLSIAALTLLLGVARAADAAGQPGAVDPFGFHESDYSLWGIKNAAYPYTGRVGCFPVGNGVIFATLGVDPDFNQLLSLTGPGYQTRDDAGGLQYWEAGNWPSMPVKLVQVTATGQPDKPYAFTPVQWQAQSIQQLRGAAMVRTIQRNDKLTLYCLTYAVPDASLLQRSFVLFGAKPGDIYGLSIDRSLAVYDDQGEQMQGDKRLVTVANQPTYKHDPRGTTVIEGLTTHYPGRIGLAFNVGYRMFKAADIYTTDEQGRPKLTDDFIKYFGQRDGEDLSPQHCYASWREWSSHNLRFNTGDPRLDDLMAQLPVTIETQRDSASGGYAPMVNYHGYWVRDSLGPIYVNLLNGRYDVVQKMLTYHRKACWKLQKCSMLVPLDIDVSDVEDPRSTVVTSSAAVSGGVRMAGAEAGPTSSAAVSGGVRMAGAEAGPTSSAAVSGGVRMAGTEAGPTGSAAVSGGVRMAGTEAGPTSSAAVSGGDSMAGTGGDSIAGTEAGPTNSWDSVPVEHAEVPSLIVLQHYWLWKCMHAAKQGDAADAFIAEAWPFITHNLFAMQFDPTYGVRFHGDETYTNGALYSTFDSGAPGELGYPNGYIPTDFFSFDNTLLHRGAATAMAEMARGMNDKAMRQKAQELGAQLDPILERYFDPTRGAYAPAISPVTGQRFPTPLLNISLSPWSLGVPCKELQLGAQFESVLFSLKGDDTPVNTLGTHNYYKCTPWSSFNTGHGLATLLNATRLNGDKRDYADIFRKLVKQATPEGAWCEVYDKSYSPVNVYGRINRIRPWESGINYAMLAAALRDGWYLRSGPYSWGGAKQAINTLCGTPQKFDTKWAWANPITDLANPQPAVGPQTKALVLTRDNHYQEMFKLDARLSALSPEEICVWDIGLPITPGDLNKSLFRIDDDTAGSTGMPTALPYLYLDRDVKQTDRRTFKSPGFWDSTQLTYVLDAYHEHGGQVIDESSLQISLADDEAVGLKVLIVLYPHTFCWDMDAETIANFHKEIAKWIGWYDQVAGDKLKLRLDFLQIDRRLPPRACGPQGGNVYWMGHGDVEADLLTRGIERNQYDSVCCFWAWDREKPSLPDGSAAAQAYGGAAEGPGGDMAFMGDAGRTSYYGAAVLKSHFITTGRVALHEYLHNIDAMFGVAGMEDQFFSADDMEQHMPQLLKERPGVFAPYGYSDAAMLDLADKSSRNEASFPWRTQLEYYKWCLERTPKSDFAKLLAHYGERVKATPRTVLYDSFILPEGEQPYEIVFEDGRTAVSGRHENTGRDARAPGLAPITIEDVDTDGYVHWRSQAWGGLTGEPYPQPTSFYKEAELVAPDLQKIVLGTGAAELRVELRDSVSKQALPGAEVTAELAGQSVALSDAGAGVYTAPLPAGLEADADVLYAASLPGYVVSDNLCALSVKPAWTAEVRFRYSDVDQPPKDAPFKPGLRVTMSGPPGDYRCKLTFTTELNTVQQMLAADGLIPQTKPFEVEFNGGAQAELDLQLARRQWEALQYCHGALRIDYTPPGNGLPLGAPTVSFTQRIAPTLPMSALLGGIDAAQLPPYIPHARRFTPKLDGELGEWPLQPSLSLTQQNGHANGAEFSGPDDGATDLWLAYDDTNLYVAGRVKDNMLKAGDMWNSDRLNLVFDALLDTTRETYPQGSVGQAGWTKDDYWVLLCPFVNGAEGKPAPLTERLGGEIPGGGKTGYFGEVGGAKAVVKEEPGGYRFEWALPLSSLPYLTPKPGGFCGFTFFLSDHDEGLTELMYLTNWWTPGGIEWRYWDCGLLYFEP